MSNQGEGATTAAAPPTTIPPALRRPGPRRIHKTGNDPRAPWTWKALVFCLLFSVPMSVGFTGRAAVLFLGQRVSGVVDGHGTHRTRRGRLVRTIYYHYSANGVTVKDDQSVTASTFAVAKGATVAVKRIRFAGMELDCVTQAVWDYLDTFLIISFFFVLAVAWLWFAAHDVLIETPRRRALVKHGVAVLGTVTAKRPAADKKESDRLTYAYHRPDGTTARTRTEFVPAAFYNQYEVGQHVVVIYSPRKPEQPTLYGLCGYAVTD